MTDKKHIKQRELTNEEQQLDQILDQIANLSERSQKTAWKRKQASMEKLISSVQEIEEKIQNLAIKKQPIMDEILTLREEMVDTCIHPREMLVEHNGCIKCKFCEKVIKLLESNG